MDNQTIEMTVEEFRRLTVAETALHALVRLVSEYKDAAAREFIEAMGLDNKEGKPC